MVVKRRSNALKGRCPGLRNKNIFMKTVYGRDLSRPIMPNGTFLDPDIYKHGYNSYVLSLHQFPQPVVAVHHVIDHVFAADGAEMLAGAVGFGFLDFAELH